MSRKDRNKNSQGQEPWEQPIYDTESDDENTSRSQQRHQKKEAAPF
ncbi:hypothetical protein [Tetragenococcus osmophilus]|uniref:Uncharacterized protein n=1 Tax=Tetragenococcus osmophilus TaxID=526944 RepID=A0AA38CVB3_9ENTE|nr:hypothetical protein [Tetragenococcus osmophilus]GMA71978.1 hypothetical protein GCM10025885_10270 [Tetragenococcus osmophilus]